MPIPNAPFLETVLDILSICPKEKVAWLDALQDVTGVTNLFPFWYFAMMEQPRNTMGSFFFVPSQVHGAVGISSIPMEPSDPKPATPCFVDKCPESLAELGSLLRHGLVTFLAAIFPGRPIGGLELAITS